MCKFLFILIGIAVFASSFTAEISLSCETSDGFVVCKDLAGTVLSVDQVSKMKHAKLNINQTSAIGPGVFGKLGALTKLTIGHDSESCRPNIINITSQSFEGLLSVNAISMTCVELRGALNPFKDLRSLKRLWFIRNQFTEFPRSLCMDIPKLKQIIVREQQITSISPTSFSRITQRLRTLALISSELKLIEPYSFLRFHHLTTLLLMLNHLDIINPEMFEGLEKLRDLNLSENRLKLMESATFSGSKNLRRINLRGNRLEILPNGIFNNLEHLKFLELDGNPISIVLHNSFQGVNGLEELTLSFSKNIQIESNAFRGVRITNLRLNADELNVLEAEAFRGLATKILFLIHNNTIDFKPNLFKGFIVERVYIWENDMTRIDKQRWGLETQIPIYTVQTIGTDTGHGLARLYEN